MGQPSAYLSQSLTPAKLTINGSFVGNGASNPTSVKGEGIASIVHTGAGGSGTYRITLREKWVRLIDQRFSVVSATARHVWCTAHDVTSGKTIDIKVVDLADAAQDLASNQTCTFVLELGGSSIS